jgi:hypothetical protein
MMNNEYVQIRRYKQAYGPIQFNPPPPPPQHDDIFIQFQCLSHWFLLFIFMHSPKNKTHQRHSQGVTKRCRLSLLTNSTPIVRVQMRGRGGVAGSQPMSTAVHITWHGAQINFEDLPLDLTMVIVFVYGTVYFLKTFFPPKELLFPVF